MRYRVVFAPKKELPLATSEGAYMTTYPHNINIIPNHLPVIRSSVILVWISDLWRLPFFQWRFPPSCQLSHIDLQINSLISDKKYLMQGIPIGIKFRWVFSLLFIFIIIKKHIHHFKCIWYIYLIYIVYISYLCVISNHDHIDLNRRLSIAVMPVKHERNIRNLISVSLDRNTKIW